MAKQRTRARVVLLVTGILAVVFVAAVVRYRDELVAWYAPVRRDFESLGKNIQGYPEYRHRQTGIVFVGLPGGTFEMGSPENESGRVDDEGPVHRVTLRPFLIAKFEVTEVEWGKVVGVEPTGFEADTLPVERVSWEDCQAFCKKSGLSFPTEAQWEYACRAGTSGPFAGTGNLNDMGWYARGSISRFRHPFGEKRPNDFGLHDMHGNVWEWCRDWYQEDFYQESAGATDPLCENSGSKSRVLRGGAGMSDARYCRSAFRHDVYASNRYVYLGFRPAWSSP